MNSNSKKSDFVYDFLCLFHQIYFSLEKHFEKRFSQAKLITFSQFWVLHCIIHCKDSFDTSQTAVAKKMHITEATLSKHIQKLVELRFLERKIDEKNRRKHILSVSKSGLSQYAKGDAVLRNDLKKIFGDVSKKSGEMIIKNFENILKKVI